MDITCGIDWAENHHDVALVDAAGTRVAKLRISDDAAGFTALLTLLAQHGDTPDDPIPVAIETSRGLLVACLRATGRPVYAINPLAVARYRERYSMARKKSDAGDAMLLANILRTDAAAHRQLPDDSEQLQAIRVLARAQQDAVWDRTQLLLRLRSLLREYFPAFLQAFGKTDEGLAGAVPRTLLEAAPDPATAAALTPEQIADLLIKAGRQRYITRTAQRLHELFQAPQMRQPPAVERAFGQQALALLHQFNATITSCDELTAATVEAFEQHPDAPIIASFPGLGTMLGARLLGELGDDRSRFPDARALKCYAGSAPVTRASGKSHAVFNRRAKNQRLASLGYQWAFCLLTTSPGALAHYRRRREYGDRHAAAQRNLFNRMLGIVHHCLTTGQTYDEATAFPSGHNHRHEQVSPRTRRHPSLTVTS
ncbi:IS110 family RNA-guided transposase [Microbispora sitophila]|uniref:IS110 family transposase n=1 Tax=Microbispora sitophila TaxID=2771537 RepID=UPI001D006F27|nr:IS110 family transposase [Microbispora sitophila]